MTAKDTNLPPRRNHIVGKNPCHCIVSKQPRRSNPFVADRLTDAVVRIAGPVQRSAHSGCHERIRR
jgi:hypothetical protein